MADRNNQQHERIFIGYFSSAAGSLTTVVRAEERYVRPKMLITKRK